MRSLRTGRLNVARSMMEISGLGVVGEARRILWMKDTISGPARMTRVLVMMRATFLGTVVAIVDYLFVLGLLCVVGENGIVLNDEILQTRCKENEMLVSWLVTREGLRLLYLWLNITKSGIA